MQETINSSYFKKDRDVGEEKHMMEFQKDVTLFILIMQYTSYCFIVYIPFKSIIINISHH